MKQSALLLCVAVLASAAQFSACCPTCQAPPEATTTPTKISKEAPQAERKKEDLSFGVCPDLGNGFDHVPPHH
jgi:hypothetical protein